MLSPEEKYGVKIEYDPLWKGPMKVKRQPTDRIWLIVFVLFVLLYVFTAIFGFRAGDISVALAPTDSAGRICGFDPEVENKSNLMYLNLKDCLNEVGICVSKTACVAKCPSQNFLFKEMKDKPLNEVKAKLICTTDINMTSITTIEQIDILIKHQRCANWYLESESVRQECIPKGIWPGHEKDTVNAEQLKKIKEAIQGRLNLIKDIGKDANKVINPVLITIFCGGIIALASVVLLRWFAIPFFYSSICMFCGITIYGIYKLTVTYVQAKRGDVLFGLILCVILLVAIIIAVIVFRKKIYLACQLIKESSKAVQRLPVTLLFPIVPWVLYIIIIMLALGVFAVLQTITVPVYGIENLDSGSSEQCQCRDYPISLLNDSASCDPETFNSKCKTSNGDACLFLQCRLQERVNPGYVKFFHTINFVGFYWLLFFVSGFEYMVLGGTFSSWYWTFNKDNVGNFSLFESISRTIRYHLGTIAIGSLILTISQIIKMLLQGLQQKLSTSNNTVASGFMMCCRSIYDMVDSFLTFLNYNAYIMCAIHGKSFLQSAKSAFQLIMRNVVNVVVVNTVADFLFVMVKILITSVTVTGLGIFYGLAHSESEDMGPFLAATIMSTIGTYAIISVIFSVQSVAANTIFLSFIEDSERNDGSDDKPYYMSNKLKQLLYMERN
ncbi:CTL-like protein 2 [Copidosoma floridanum]|uniref:CTL-like protein 2 n=1 Tax=Copidosoma floridanum TaxID=29053 RepID=UPI0006C9B19A|nr:CTL-like protein 2 [Copidosoma floridanum]